MTPAELLEWLADPQRTQRDKLVALHGHAAAIRGYDDDRYRAAIREIKKTLKSPKLAGELAALLGEIDRGRVPTPSPAAVTAEPPPVPWVPSDPEDARGSELEAAIAADPEAQDRYLVYGDHLSGRGDPRGELIAIGHALAKNPTHKAMLEAHKLLLAVHPDQLWGGAVAYREMLGEVVWYLGFIKGCSLILPYNFRAVPLAGVLEAVLDGPGRFLQDLTIPAANDQFAEIAAAIARRPRPTLRRVTLGSYYTNLGDVSAMWPALTGVRELVLDGTELGLGTIAAPQLAKLSINYGPRGNGHTLVHFATLFAATTVPALRSLTITNCECADELCRVLAESPLLPQLRALDLAMGTLTAAGVATIVAHRERFAHLELGVDLNYLPEEAEATLAACVARLRFGEQRSDDREYRHAADYE